MRSIGPFMLGAIALAFLWVVYLLFRTWGKMGVKKRIASVLLLAPDFLLVGSIVVSLLCGHPPQGSQAFNTQFFCAVLIVFILPFPALVGTVMALVVFRRARLGL